MYPLKIASLLIAALVVAACTSSATAASRTEWTSGNGQGLGSWSSRTIAFGTADLTSLPSGDSVLSSATAIANGTNLDQYMDISVQVTIGSATPSPGAFIAIYAATLQQDGSTYGDGQLTAGSQAAYVPQYAPICIVPIESTAALTLMAGSCAGVLLPPETFAFVAYNFTGLAFSATAASNVVAFKTYNINLNN